MSRHTTPREIYVGKRAGPVTIHVGVDEEEMIQTGNSGCLLLIVLIILLGLVVSAATPEEVPVAALMAYVFCL